MNQPHQPERSLATRKSAIIARVYREWAAEQNEVTGSVAPVDAEGATVMGAGYEAEADLDKRIMRALEAEGLAPPTSLVTVTVGTTTYSFAPPLHVFTEVTIDHADGLGPGNSVPFGGILNREADPDALIDAFEAAGHPLTEAPPYEP